MFRLRSRLAVVAADERALVVATKRSRRLLFGLAALLLAGGAVVGVGAEDLSPDRLPTLVWYFALTLGFAVGAGWRRELRVNRGEALYQRATFVRWLWTREQRYPATEVAALALWLPPHRVATARLTLRRAEGPDTVLEVAQDPAALEALGAALASYLGVSFERNEP